jgi:hypothetical protein
MKNTAIGNKVAKQLQKSLCSKFNVKHTLELSCMAFIVLELETVKNIEFMTKASTIKNEQQNIRKLSILSRFRKIILFSNGLYTAIESGKVFHMTNHAPAAAINPEMTRHM